MHLQRLQMVYYRSYRRLPPCTSLGVKVSNTGSVCVLPWQPCCTRRFLGVAAAPVTKAAGCALGMRTAPPHQ